MALEIEHVWGPSQGRFLRSQAGAILYETAVRVGKTTVGCHRCLKESLAFPGMAWCLSRATDEATMGVLAPVWRGWLAKNGMEVKWNAAEGCDVFPNGSRVYLRGVLSTDATRRYS